MYNSKGTEWKSLTQEEFQIFKKGKKVLVQDVIIIIFQVYLFAFVVNPFVSIYDYYFLFVKKFVIIFRNIFCLQMPLHT